MMEKEILLSPRYKAIADYPASRFEIDEILELDENDRWNDFDAVNVDGDFHPRNYPHLFKELHWSEGRTKQEMPEYVKIITKSFKDYGQIRKVNRWSYYNREEFETGAVEAHWLAEGEHLTHHVNHLEPATEAEFNTQNK